MINKVAVSFIFAIFLLGVAIPTANAQIGFLLGTMTGAILFGGDDQQFGASSANVVYTLPRASERVTDPLGIKFASTPKLSFRVPSSYNGRPSYNVDETALGSTIYSLFRSVESRGNYEILQVIRVIDSQSPATAVFWFAYIEKEKVLSLEALKKK